MLENTPKTIPEYFSFVSADHQYAIKKLHDIITNNLPEGYESGIEYGMIYYFIPHKLYPSGYHVDQSKPLGLMALASQKNYIALYHMGLYANKSLLDWFVDEYSKTGTKLNMGKSCIRFSNSSKIPYDLVAELAKKISVQQYIHSYESSRNQKRVK